MNFIYHRVPPQLKGNTLYPLNELRELHPELYINEVKKYSGREKLLNWRIEPLDCVWNDVLFFSPVHPKDIRKAMNEASVHFHALRFFQIPATYLNPEMTVIRHYRRTRLELPRYDSYDPVNLAPYAKPSEAMAQDYREQLARGQKRVFVFEHVPHILYKGVLDVTGLPIIEV